MAAQISRPGVEVIQVFRAVSPTIITPTLVPNVVGVCKQIVEVLESDGAGGNVLNSDALIVLPALAIADEATGDPAVYTGLDGLNLIFSANGMPAITVTFSDPLVTGLTPASVVAQVRQAIAAAGATGVTADVVESNPQWQLRTVGTGDFQSIFIDPLSDPAVLSAFGFGGGKTYAGLSAYNQDIVVIPEEAFPDPRKNLSELGILSETVRVFLATGNGTNLQEAHRTQAFLRNGSVADPAFIDGTVDITGLTYPANVTGKIITLDHNGTQLTHTVASPGTATAFVAELVAAFASIGVTFQQLTSPAGHLRIKTTTGGATETLTAVSGNLLTTIGVTPGATDTGESISAVDDGNGDAVTALISFAGAITVPDFTASPTAAVLSLTGTYPLAANGTLILSGGDQPQTISLTAGMTAAQVFAAINEIVAPAAGGLITGSSSGASNLTLTHSETGTDSVIQVVGGTSLSALGAAVGFTRGIPCKPLPGDELWIDGVFFANIVEVAPGGSVSRLKIDRQVAISSNIGTSWFIIAKNLNGAPAVGRPNPELMISLTQAAIVKQELLRDTTGSRIDAKAQIYLAYQAVRKDVSPLAAQPGILRFDDTTQLANVLSPITTDNPLALGLFFALLNAPGVQVTGLGVDAVTDDAPFGTVEAFTRAAEYLESNEVYAIAPLTHDETVHQVFSTHATVMSQPENKGERIALINPTIPTTKRDKLVASGTNGDRLTTTTFDTKVANISSLLLNAGVDPIGTIPTSAGAFLQLASSADRFSIQSISGSVVTIRTSFAAGENDDGFYTTDTLPLAIAETFAVDIRGATLTVAGVPDKDGIALTLQELAQSYGNRRTWLVVPDKCAATLEGLEQVIDGFYMCAAISGMIGQQPPQQSFTNFPMTGFTRVIGSNDTFKQSQINVMAAGGCDVIVQDAVGAPLISQFALTTDMTSVETRTDSITKVVDFTAKFLRKGIKNFIGRFNITQGLLDTLSSVIQGLLGYLVENGILIGADLNNIIQDETNPDTVLVEVRLDVPFPCNFIKLTLQV
jgi:hypothetical protein